MQGEVGGSVDWVAHIPIVLAIIAFAAIQSWAHIELRSRRMFMTREELINEIGGMKNLFSMNRASVDEMRDRLTRIEATDKLRWEPVASALSKIGDQVEKMQQQLPAIVATLDAIQRRLDDHERSAIARDRDPGPRGGR
jgi:hypothetical protein